MATAIKLLYGTATGIKVIAGSAVNATMKRQVAMRADGAVFMRTKSFSTYHGGPAWSKWQRIEAVPTGMTDSSECPWHTWQDDLVRLPS
jgi:hypothetical protein